MGRPLASFEHHVFLVRGGGYALLGQAHIDLSTWHLSCHRRPSAQFPTCILSAFHLGGRPQEGWHVAKQLGLLTLREPGTPNSWILQSSKMLTYLQPPLPMRWDSN